MAAPQHLPTTLMALRAFTPRSPLSLASTKGSIRCISHGISRSQQCQRKSQPFRRRLSGSQRWQSTTPKEQDPPKTPQPDLNSKLASTLQQSDQSDLVTEVNLPPDPDGVLPSFHSALPLLANSSLVIQRQLEMMNVILSVEQANRYIIMDGQGNTIGYMAEQDHGIGRAIARQAAKLHRSFTTYIFDKDYREVLRIHRPFAYINSRIRIYDPVPKDGYDAMESTPTNDAPHAQTSPLKLDEMRVIGECHQVWAATRRKYALYTLRPSIVTSTTGVEHADAVESEIPDKAIEASMAQFSSIDEPMLSWDFTVKTEDDKVMGSVNRDFGGFAREVFTDTGVYALRMDAAAQSVTDNTDSTDVAHNDAPGLTLDQRAVMIATAISIDFDYFSRHSSSMGGIGYAPLFWPTSGAAAGEGAAAGAAGGAIAGEVGAAGRSVAGAGAVESGIAGAGTMAGYEAMQRGFGRGDEVDDASPQSAEPYGDSSAEGFVPDDNAPSGDDVWGSGKDPWSEQPSAGAGDGEGGSGLLGSIWEWFTDS